MHPCNLHVSAQPLKTVSRSYRIKHTFDIQHTRATALNEWIRNTIESAEHYAAMHRADIDGQLAWAAGRPETERALFLAILANIPECQVRSWGEPIKYFRGDVEAPSLVDLSYDLREMLAYCWGERETPRQHV
jgi:hypothetical protein